VKFPLTIRVDLFSASISFEERYLAFYILSNTALNAYQMAEPPKYPGAKASSFYLARSEICVDAAGECIGDGVFAGCNFGSGEHLVTMHRPLVASLYTERLHDTCANCYTWTEGSSIGSRLYVKEGTKVQACAGCKRFRYCSKV
jgi:hypothetical protein